MIGFTYRIHFIMNETSTFDFLGKCVSLSPPTFSNINAMNRNQIREIIKGPVVFLPELFTFHESGETILLRKTLNAIIPYLGDEYTKPN